MPNYQNGKIYTIRSFQTNDIYIGSTVEQLSKRFNKHKVKYNQWKKGTYRNTTSFQILNYEDAYIELLENYPCNSKEELRMKEGEYQRKMDCVNKRIEGRTHKEYRNSTEGKKVRNKYCEEHKEHLYNKKKEYNSRADVKEYKKQKDKEYYQNNREQILENMKTKITCVCGITLRKSGIKRHERTKNHIRYIQNCI
jgi:hypothetical protein